MKMATMAMRALVPVLSLALPLLGGCAGFQFPGASMLQPLMPRVDVADVALTGAPSNRLLAGYYCAQIAPRLICNLIGPVPGEDQLKFTFETHLDVHNQNPFPLPLVEALTGFTAFPQATAERNVGAVCLSMCDDPSSCAQGKPDACKSDKPDIKGLGDFASATAGFLRAVVTGQAGLDNLRVKTVPASGQNRIAVKLELAPEMVLGLLKTLAGDALAEVRQGRVPQFVIPYKAEGSLFMNIENFGRLAAPFGPHQNEWRLQ